MCPSLKVLLIVPSFIKCSTCPILSADSVQYCVSAAWTDVIGNAVKIVVRARIPVHTRFHIFFIFYNSFLFNQKKTSVWNACCCFMLFAPCCHAGEWESPTCRKRRCSRLLIVFSAGNLLVNQRGRVWGGEIGKSWFLVDRQRIDFSLGVKMPIVPCFFPVSGIIPVLW